MNNTIVKVVSTSILGHAENKFITREVEADELGAVGMRPPAMVPTPAYTPKT
ncbi:MAG: hypothetical protein QXH64_01390 [Nitrososphaeria archaeon]